MSLLDDVSIVVTPNGYKAGELYAVVPVPTEGAEEVVNGDFATDSDWTKGTGITIAGGVALFTSVSSGQQLNQVPLRAVTGKRYKISYEIKTRTEGAFSASIGGTLSLNQNSEVGVYTEYLTATGADSFYIRSRGTTSGSIDNVSVKEATIDNLPRVDYTDGTSSLLVEPQRTNLITYSEDFSEWSKLGSTEVTPDTTISPDGTLNADSFTFTTSTSDKIQQTVTVVASQQYTVSCYIKSDSNITIKMGGAAASTPINVTTEWVRHTVTQTNGAGTTAYPQLTSNGTAGTVYVYGFQLEEASYPTSYIPTSGSTVTRNKDIFTRDGIGSLINSTEGVLFVEMAALSDDNTDRRLSLNDGSANNEIRIGYSRFTGNIISEVASGGITQNINWGATGVTQTNNNKFALSWGNGTLKFYVNGSQTNIETGITSPVGLNTLKFSKGNDIEEMFAKVKQLQVYKTALTDEQLLQLTGTSGTDFYESYAEMASALTYTIQ